MYPAEEDQRQFKQDWHDLLSVTRKQATKHYAELGERGLRMYDGDRENWTKTISVFVLHGFYKITTRSRREMELMIGIPHYLITISSLEHAIRYAVGFLQE